MKWGVFLLLFGCVLAGWLVIGLVHLHSGAEPRASLAPRPAEREIHYATPGQLADAGARAGRRVEPFTGVDHTGRTVAFSELCEGRPLVLVFLKNGCPCNVEFEPHFQRLQQTYHDCVAFAGVIDADSGTARRYCEANRVRYPLLTDPERTIIARLRAENGGYVLLLTAEGVVGTVWPGWSAEMMQELGRKAAALAGVPERPLDVRGLPNALTTGCPYSL
jgi:peroxiredoxin